MGASQEDATKEGGGAGRLGKVLSHGSPGGAVVLDRDVGVVGPNGAEVRRGACGFPDTN